MFDHVLYVDLPDGHQAFFSWPVADMDAAKAMAKKQLDVLPVVPKLRICFKGATDFAASQELADYMNAKAKP